MVQQLVTKFGLAAHVALLAALPLALAPFLSPGTLGVVMLWLSAFVAVWFLLAPSIRAGEGLSDARRRTLLALLRDPLTWFFVFALVYQLVVWLNSSEGLSYDPENVKWVVKAAPYEGLPSSVKDSGFLPFCTTLAVAFSVQAIRLALGRKARTWCALAAAFIAGLGALAAVMCAFKGVGGLDGAALRNIGEAPFAGSLYIAWLFVALAAGAQAEGENWGKSRLPFAVALGGCVSAVVFLMPPIASGITCAAAFLFFFWALAYAARTGKGGGAAKLFVMVVLALSIPAFTVMLFASPETREAKAAQFAPSAKSSAEGDESEAAAEGEPATASSALSGIARRIWQEAPWSGAGVGAYGVKARFAAEQDDWRLLPPKIDWPCNSYWGILAERGIAGCAVIATGLAFLLVFFAIRAVEAFFAVRESDDYDVFIFAVQPVSWCIFVVLPLMAVDAAYSAALHFDVSAFCWAVPLALASASFPRRKKEVNKDSV